MKEITIDWIEYVLLKKEKATLEPIEEDKYKKIRERVKRDDNELHILWENKVIISYNDGGITLIDKEYISKDELHFEECTLWDLKENDVFVYADTVYVVIKIKYNIFVNYLRDDMIYIREMQSTDNSVIKILRH